MSSRFARNSLFSTLGGLATALGSFLSMVIVARLLGPSGTGTIAYALWLATLAVTIADFGIVQTLTRYLPELTAEGDDRTARDLAAALLRPCLALAILGAVLFGWLGTGAAGPTPDSPTHIWWLIGLLFTLQFVASFGLGLLRGLQRFDTAAKLTVLSFLLQLAAVAAGALADGVEGALFGYCAGSLLPIGAIVAALPRRHAVDPGLRRRVLRFALFSWAGALTVAFVWSRLEVFFLQRSFGAEAVALYTIGFTFSNLASQGPLLLTGGLLAYFSENFGQRRTDRIGIAYTTATRLMAFLLLPACFGLAAILPALLPLVYGQAYAPAVPAACVLVAGAAIGATGSVGSQMIYAHDRSDFIFASGLVGAVLTILSGFLVIPQFGLMGAAVARTAIHAVMLGLGAWFITRRFGYPMPMRELCRLLVAALLCAGAASLCIHLVRDPRSALVLAVASGAVVYIAAVRALGALPQSDIERLRRLLGRIPVLVRGPMSGLLTLLAPRRA